MKTRNYLGIGAALLAVVGCASTGPSTELVDARQAYATARASSAQQLAPDKLLSAKQALDAAEKAHDDDAGSNAEKSLAYIAARRSELAQAYGDLALAQNQQAAANKNYVATQDRLRQSAEQRANTTARSLEATQNALAQTRNYLGGKLAASEQARLEAEKRANAAIESLRQIASVKEESRGMVITLDGAVLFVTGKAELIPIAQQKLNDVAEALKQTDDDQKIVVEGYTDSRGSDDFNLRLSQERADAVRSYLIGRGIKPERVTSQGKGEANPVATNDTPEGRANNRRVEIIVQPRAKSGNTPSSTGSSTNGTSSGSSGSSVGGTR